MRMSLRFRTSQPKKGPNLWVTAWLLLKCGNVPSIQIRNKMIHMRKSDSKTTEELLKLWIGITKKTSKKKKSLDLWWNSLHLAMLWSQPRIPDIWDPPERLLREMASISMPCHFFNPGCLKIHLNVCGSSLIWRISIHKNLGTVLYPTKIVSLIVSSSFIRPLPFYTPERSF